MKEKAVLLPKLIYTVSFTHVLKNNSPGKRNFILPPDFFPQIFYFSIRRNKENRNINVWNPMKKIRTVSGEHIFLHVWNWVNKSFVSKFYFFFCVLFCNTRFDFKRLKSTTARCSIGLNVFSQHFLTQFHTIKNNSKNPDRFHTLEKNR